MRTLSLTALLLFNIVLVLAQQYTPATVPNTKLVNNSYVSNPDGIISESTVAEIDSIFAHVEQQTTAQVAVVVLKSIGDADLFTFAQELFNTWGIGKSNNNGLLILLVEDIHSVRFHTGFQLEGILPDVVCKQIQRDKMVPSFKEGNYDAGMLGGISEVAKILTDPNYSIEIAAPDEDIVQGYTGIVIFLAIFLVPIFFIAWGIKNSRFSNSKDPTPTDYPQMRMKRSTWLILFGGIPALIIALFWIGNPEGAEGLVLITLYLYLMGTILIRIIRERRMFNKLREERKYFEITEYFRRSQGYWFVMALIFPLPFLAYFPFHFVRKKFYRNHPRKCTLCDGAMNKLGEKEDDQYLTKGQLVEETIDSVDYDVWQCESCSATEAWHFRTRWSKYEPCTKCKAIAWYLVENKTLKAATYSKSGKGESLYQCKACGNSERKAYSIAVLTTSSSSSSSSSGGSSYSGGSSSSGGSWGGGSSGGGGASSSW